MIGPAADFARIQRYAAAAAEALSRIGVETVVLGSGESRDIPENWERGSTEQQFVQLLQILADELSGTGVMLAIEPLNRENSNFINSIPEAVHYAAIIDRPHVKGLADFYHMDEENEPLDNLILYKNWLTHIHLADTDRYSPGTGHHYSKLISLPARNRLYALT